MKQRPTRRRWSRAALVVAVCAATACSDDSATSPRQLAPPSMSSSASLSYLEADAPGDYGGISVGIAPYASGGPFGGFQRTPCQGVES